MNAGLLGIIATLSAVVWLEWRQLGAADAQIDELRLALAARAGDLDDCEARLTNIQQAETRNATIPDDLFDFDLPADWLLPSPAGRSDTRAP